MKIAVVLSFDVPTPEDAAEVLAAIDPPHLEHFDGVARIVVPPYTGQLERWLDDSSPDPRTVRPNTFGQQKPRNRRERRHGFR